MDEMALRGAIYQWFVEQGSAPSNEQIVSWVGDPQAAAAMLRRLHDGHALVLDEVGSIRMALPFSGVPTAYVVRRGEKRWMANCAWDSLAIPAALGSDAHIDGPWLDQPGSVQLDIIGGRLSHQDGYVHFLLPAARWWDDIVET
jgi:hypothetical protein